MAFGSVEVVKEGDCMYVGCYPHERILNQRLRAIVDYLFDIIINQEDQNRRQSYEEACNVLINKCSDYEPHQNKLNLTHGDKNYMLLRMKSIIPFPCDKFYGLIEEAADAATRHLQRRWFTPNTSHFEDDGFKLVRIFYHKDVLEIIPCYMHVVGYQRERAHLPLCSSRVIGKLYYEHKKFTLNRRLVSQIVDEM